MNIRREITMAKSRVKELDFMRAAAMLMVVLLHVSAAYVAYSPVDSKVFYLGLILNQWSHLPAFICFCIRIWPFLQIRSEQST